MNAFTAQTGYASSPAPVDIPNAPPRVCDGLGVTEQALSTIQESISALEKRLDVALRPEPPTGQTGSGATLNRPVTSHLAGRIDILNDGFANVNRRLREITARIEV